MSGKPRVALFSTHFLSYSQTFVYEQLKNHERYDVDVFCREHLNHEQFPHPNVHEAGPLYSSTRISPYFDRVFTEQKFSLVHAHFGTGAVYAMRFAQRHGLPLAVTFHGYDVPLLGSPKRWLPQYWRYAWFGPRMLKQLDLALCCSNELHEMLLQLGVNQERTVVHRLGIDIDAFSPGERPDGPTQVIMVGRFVEKKGMEYGLEAFADQIKQGADAMLTIVGDGERRDALRAIVANNGIENRVTFTGVLPSQEVSTALQKSHILLCPSVVAADGDRESGLIVAKEASACHVVPVGTYHGGIPEIIDDEVTGFLVEERDSAALSDRLGRLFQSRELCHTMGAAARAKMEREYDNREQVRALERHYDAVIERAAKTGEST